MKSGFPRASNHLEYRRGRNGKQQVLDYQNGYLFEMDRAVAAFLRRLDGKTDPYAIDRSLPKEEVDARLAFFQEENLLRRGRVLSRSALGLMYTLWIPKNKRATNCLPRILNWLLMLLWLPVPVLGWKLFLESGVQLQSAQTLPGGLLSLIPGMFLHELGHAIAVLAYGGAVFEMGLQVDLLLPGAYVIMESGSIKNRLHRVQTAAAGVEMNLLLTGVFLMLAAKIPALSGGFFGAAVYNFFLALLNLSFVRGLDGMSMMSTLLGAEDAMENSRKYLFRRKTWKELKQRGIVGIGELAACLLLNAVSVLLPALLVLNLLEVIAWIF